MTESAIWDVIVVGAGNAALCAALSAAEQGAKVLVLEKATKEDRGGNSTFTAGGFRFCHDGVEDLRTDILDDMTDGEYASIGSLPTLNETQFMETLMKVTEHNADEDLANILIGRSRETMRWMRTHKIRFIPMFGRQSFKIEGKHHFYGGVNIEAVGGGWGLVDMLVTACERMGITIRYECGLRDLIQDQKGRITGVRAFGPDGYEDINGKAVVLALKARLKCAYAIWGRAGTCAGCEAHSIIPVMGSTPRCGLALGRTAAGQAVMRCNGTFPPRLMATAWCSIISRSTATPSALS
jgi:tricarballylate dehydrogenase